MATVAAECGQVCSASPSLREHRDGAAAGAGPAAMPSRDRAEGSALGAGLAGAPRSSAALSPLTGRHPWAAVATAAAAALVAPGTLLVGAAQVQARPPLPGDGARSCSACEDAAGGTAPWGTLGQPRMASGGPGWLPPPGMSTQMQPQPAPVHLCPRGTASLPRPLRAPAAGPVLALCRGRVAHCHQPPWGAAGRLTPGPAAPTTSGHSGARPAAAGAAALLLSPTDTIIQTSAPVPAPGVPAWLPAHPGVPCGRRGDG